jgi:pyruvate dehydrogenase E1 component beta subunit
MGVEIKMPALSPTMEEGTLAKWLVKAGDSVKSGDILAEIETDKATMEFEAVDEGEIGEILVVEGTDNVKVGTVIATMAGEGGTPVKAAKAAPPVVPEVSLPAEALSSPPPPKPAPESSSATGKLTLREALRDAMAEEMRTDDRVFVMGEEVAEYQGAYRYTDH